MLPVFDKLTLPELKKALDGPDAFFREVAAIGGPVCIRLLVAQLRPKLQPIIQRVGMQWADILSAISLVDTVEELQAALSDPEAFLESLVSAGGEAAKRMLLAKMRPKLEPMTNKQGLAWEDVLQAFELIDEISELQVALTNPTAFLSKVLNATGPLGKKVALAKLRSKLEPIVSKQGLQWADCLQAFEMIDTLEELQAALTAPAAFLEKLASATGPAAKKMILAKLRPKLEPVVSKQGLHWPDVVQAFELVDELSELKAAIEKPSAFLADLVHKGGAAAKRMLLARFRPKLEPLASKQGLDWEDMMAVVDMIDEIHEIEAAITKPAVFLKNLASAGGAVGKKMLVARMRPPLEPITNKLGLTWSDVVAALDLITDINELKTALEAPGEFFTRMAEDISDAGKKMLIARLRPILEPLLRKSAGVDWAALVDVLEDISIEQLRAILDDPKAFLEQIANSNGKPEATDVRNAVTVVHSTQIANANTTDDGGETTRVAVGSSVAVDVDSEAAGAGAGGGGGGGGGGIFSGVGSIELDGIGGNISEVADRAGAMMKEVGNLWSEFGEALSGPMFRILISLYQVLKPLGAVFEIQYPPIYLDFMGYFGVIELDFLSIDAMPTSCWMRINFIHSTILRTAGPLVVIGLMAWVTSLLNAKAKRKASEGMVGDARKATKLADTIGNGIFMLIFIICAC